MSEKECRNDCTRPLRFPRRPGHNVADGASDCFCCSPNEHVSIDNRPSLSHFNYRIGTYATIREWLIRKLDLTPSLQSWTHREADDPGIALLEGAAILGDILTFYQELYANEAFLRTATWRESISDLVRLLGYRLSPGIGGKTTFAFEVKGTQSITVPANFPVKADLEGFEKPSDFETTEEITAYPWLSRFNLFRPMTTPQVGATTSEFYISGASTVEINKGDKLLIGDESTAASGMPTKLVNAEVVIVDSVRELHGIKLIKIKGALQKRTSAVGQIKAFKLGRMFHHFGHNGPQTIIRTPNPIETEATVDSTNPQKTTIKTNINEISIIFTRSLSSTTSSSSIGFSNYQSAQAQISFLQNSSQSQSAPQSQQQMIMMQTGNSNSNIVSNIGSNVGFEVNVNVPDFAYLYSERIVSPSLTNKEFPLDAEVPDLPSGVPFIVQITFAANDEVTVIRKIKNVRSDSVTWGQLTGTVSIVTLETALSSSTGTHTTADIRKMIFHEVIGEAFTLKASLIETSPLPVNKVLAFYGTSEQAQSLRGRRILFEKAETDARVLTVMDVITPAWDLPLMHYITVSDEVIYADFPQENPTVTVYGNLVDATEGKTLPEVVLGSGDNTQVFQTFKLPKAPLTYHLSATETPPETPEIEIYVAGRRWQQVSTLFGHSAKEEIYIVREDAANNSWVQFGDGKTGLRLPTGIKNVSAVYRIGTGAFGALKPDTKAQASAKLKNLDKIQMPGIATGGAEPEDGENARFAAPGKVQSLDRLVSLRDFETEAAAIPGVALASATWSLRDNIPSVAITALMETGRVGEFSAVQKTINNYNRGRGPQRFPVLVNGGKRLYVNIAAQYALDPNYREELVKPEIEKALGVNFGKATNKEDQTGLFSLRRRRFGAREYSSTIEGVIQNVQGVVWAKVTAFNFLSDVDDPATITITSSFNTIVSCDELHVLSLYYKHLTLTLLQQGGI